MGQRALKFYKRPIDLSDEMKLKIRELFPFIFGYIDWENESIVITGHHYFGTEIPFEAIGKMIGLMNNAGVTVRKSKKDKK